jgi:hypothetical protein
MKKAIIVLTAIVFVFASYTILPAFELADGKVVIHGKVSEQLAITASGTSPGQLYDYDIFNFRTTLKLETMFHLQQCPEYEINLYGVWKEFYDYAHEVDSGYNNYLEDFSGHHGIQEVRSYNTFRDICRELFLEYTTSTFQIRAGKQIVSWGETSFERTADIVNPVDARGLLNPGYPDFAEIKRGLWMLRFYITPADMPLDMTFEGLIIPDFEPTRNWPAGYHLAHPEGFNALQNPNELFLVDYRDKPKTWGNPDLGFRIRGFLKGFDWTFFYLNKRDNNPVVRTGRGVALQLSALNRKLFGRAEDLKSFQRYNNVGFTFNRPINKKFCFFGTDLAMSGNMLRAEFIAELSKKATNLVGAANDVRGYNRYATTIGWDTKIFIPGLTPWNRNKHLSSSTQLAMEWTQNKHKTYQVFPYVTYSLDRHAWQTVTQSFDYGFWNDRILAGFYGAYGLTRGTFYYTFMTAFKPTFSWTYMIRYLNYVETTKTTEDLDQVLFDITYEF